jgi:hypothetical protein
MNNQWHRHGCVKIVMCGAEIYPPVTVMVNLFSTLPLGYTSIRRGPLQKILLGRAQSVVHFPLEDVAKINTP